MSLLHYLRKQILFALLDFYWFTLHDSVEAFYKRIHNGQSKFLKITNYLTFDEEENEEWGRRRFGL